MLFLALAVLLPADAGGETPQTYFGDRYEDGLAAARKLDTEYLEGIRITGTPAFIERVSAALGLIESRDARSWYYTRKNIRRVTLNGHAGIDIGGGRITAADDPNEPPPVFAGRIVHEAWHAELARSDRTTEGAVAEAYCMARQNEFLRRAGLTPIDLKGALESRYWEKDYWSRDW